MHCTVFAPLLSATISVVCIWIISLSPHGASPRAKARDYNIRTKISQNSKPYSDLAGPFQHLHQTPGLGLGQRPAFLDLHQIAFFTLVALVMRVQLGMTRHDLAVQRMADTAIHLHGNRLVHLVADHASAPRARGFFFFSPFLL